MRTGFRVVPALALTAAAGVCTPLGAQTREFLNAPAVKSQIRITWDAAAKKVAYAIDDSAVFRDLPDNKLFLVLAVA